MAIRQHGDTEAPPRGLDALLQDAQHWAFAHVRELAVAAGVLLLAAVVVAGVMEWRGRQQVAAEMALGGIEADFAQAMGASPNVALVPEPANAEQARAAREAALAQYEEFLREHSGTQAARVARLRAAELEVDLGRLEAADARLVAVIGELGDADPRKGIALRLRGYVLEELERPLEAAAAYAAAGALESHPARLLAWLVAARTYARAGQPAEALRAYREAQSLEPRLGEDPSFQSEMAVLEGTAGTAGTAGAGQPAAVGSGQAPGSPAGP
jgi:tetratricopeptide (TPR) repeat protein